MWVRVVARPNGLRGCREGHAMSIRKFAAALLACSAVLVPVAESAEARGLSVSVTLSAAQGQPGFCKFKTAIRGGIADHHFTVTMTTDVVPSGIVNALVLGSSGSATNTILVTVAEVQGSNRSFRVLDVTANTYYVSVAKVADRCR